MIKRIGRKLLAKLIAADWMLWIIVWSIALWVKLPFVFVVIAFVGSSVIGTILYLIEYAVELRGESPIGEPHKPGCRQ